MKNSVRNYLYVVIFFSLGFVLISYGAVFGAIRAGIYLSSSALKNLSDFEACSLILTVVVIILAVISSVIRFASGFSESLSEFKKELRKFHEQEWKSMQQDLVDVAKSWGGLGKEGRTEFVLEHTLIANRARKYEKYVREFIMEDYSLRAYVEELPWTKDTSGLWGKWPR